MRKIEKDNIINFLDAMMENDYSKANSNLGVLIKEKIRNKLMEAKKVKPFGKDDSDDSCESCDDSESKKPTSKKPKSGKKKKGNLPPWLNKKNKNSK
jgi:hypothetical protein